ncbi:hypothetical protein N0V90_007860 [Kalmusia sp. IMI 367209]|nr:hypothetical protein N0V90_007860 [Kalmusia sp. IMI 367209]
MAVPVSAQCRACITTLKTIISTLSDPNKQKSRLHHQQVNDELERFSLWIGNIGAIHLPESPLSLESRLHGSEYILTHILKLLNDLNEITKELLEMVSGGIDHVSQDDLAQEDQIDETELLAEISASITCLFRVSRLIREAAHTDLFTKALSRDRYQFNDQYDIAHVGEKYPKLVAEEWLQKRLGRAITQRRHYLSYIRDHRDKLEGALAHNEALKHVAPTPQIVVQQLPTMKSQLDSASRPSTFFTKATSLAPGSITTQMLSAEESDSENDLKSHTTVSRSLDGELDVSATVKIPKLDDLRAASKEFECPFCFQMKRYKNERVWRRHVFSDLRTYICTFPDCDAPYFGDINEWFRHEMQTHRVSYACQICHGKIFQLKDRYLTHVRKRHAVIAEDNEEQLLVDISRKPLNEIPAQQCPCCSDWVDRLKERVEVVRIPHDASGHIISVDPTVFKRHLASHLEQLALFAIPINLSAEYDSNSNVAIEADVDALGQSSNLSTLTFESSRPPLPEGVEVETENMEKRKIELMPQFDQREADISSSQEAFSLSEGGHLDDANSVAGQVVEATPEANPGRAGKLIDLETKLESRSRNIGHLSDLEAEIHVAEEELSCTPEDHPDRPARLMDLGAKMQRRFEHTRDIDDIDKATSILERAVSTVRPDHPNLPVWLNNLGSTLERRYWFTTDIDDLNRAISVSEQLVSTMPKDHADFPYWLDTLCTRLNRRYERRGSLDDLEKAIQIARQAVDLTSEGNSDVIERLNNLAFLQHGDFEEAVTILRRALHAANKLLGSNHPTTLQCMNDLELTLRNQRDFTEAEDLSQDIIDEFEKRSRPEHSSTRGSMSNLVLVLQDQGKFEAAEVLSRRTLEESEKVLGVGHVDTLVNVSQLGTVLEKQGRYEEAEALHQQAVEGYKNELGPEDPDTLTSMEKLALALRGQGRWKEADDLEAEVKDTRERGLGDEHPGPDSHG